MVKSHDEEKWKLMSQYSDNIDKSTLSSELEILRTICKADKLINFDDIVGRIQQFLERSLIKNIITAVKLVLVGAATNVTQERSF